MSSICYLHLKVFMFYGTTFKYYDLPLPRKPHHEWALVHEESPMNNFLFSFEEVMTLFNHKGIGLPSRHSVPEKRRMARQHKASTLCEREKHPIRALEVSPGDICEHRLRYWFWQRRLCTTSDEVRSSRFVWTVSTQQRFTSEVSEDFFLAWTNH